MSEETASANAQTQPGKRKFQFPSAVTTLAIVSILVWVAALFIPAGKYDTDADGSPIPGTYQRIESPLTSGAQGRAADPRPGQRHLRPAEPGARIRRHPDGRAPVRPDRRHRLHHVHRCLHLDQLRDPQPRGRRCRAGQPPAQQGMAAHRRRHGAVLAARLHDGLLGGDARASTRCSSRSWPRSATTGWSPRR